MRYGLFYHCLIVFLKIFLFYKLLQSNFKSILYQHFQFTLHYFAVSWLILRDSIMLCRNTNLEKINACQRHNVTIQADI